MTLDARLLGTTAAAANAYQCIVPTIIMMYVVLDRAVACSESCRSYVLLPPSPLPKAVPAAGRFRLPLTPLSLRFLPYPSRAARAPQKPWLQRRPSHSQLIYPGVLYRRRPPPRPPVRLCPSPSCLALQPLRRRRRAD